MEQEFELIAKTFMGLEPVLAQELTELGANNVQTGRRMVSFTGNKEMMYRANFQLHTAIRILKPIAHFKADTADKVYDEIKKIDWTQYLDLKKSFSVDSVVFSEEFRHSKFVSYKVKDAIIVHSIEELMEELKKYPAEDVYCIGGDTIYKQLLPYCDAAQVTKIDFAYIADSYFPNLDEDPQWHVAAESEEQTYFDLEYKFVRYERNK